MIRYKIDVLEALKEKGLTTYKLRQDKLLNEGAVKKLRKSEMVGMKSLDQICGMLGCDVGDIIQYEKGT